MMVRYLLKKQLPPNVYRLLHQASRLAEDRQLPAYLVGGVVRDLLLRRPNLDLDLVIEGDAIAFAQDFGKKLGAQVIAHPRFGTAVIRIPDGLKFDVARARSERYEAPGALPIVEPSGIEKDLARRDFTINALAVRLDGSRFGEVLDCYGGTVDLRHGVVRVLHPLSFVDDPTRIFRAVRFEQRYGFRLATDTATLLERAVQRKMLHRLSPARLREEIIALLSEENPAQMIARLVELDLLQFIHPGLRRSKDAADLKHPLKTVAEAMEWHKTARTIHTATRPLASHERSEPWLPYLAAVMKRLSPRAVRAVAKRLALSGRQAAILKTARLRTGALLKQLGRQRLSPSQIVRILSGLPDEVLIYLLAQAPEKPTRRRIQAYVTEYRYVRPLLTGQDLKGMGMKPGPAFKRVLERLLKSRLDGETKTHAEERELVRKMIGYKKRNAHA